MKISAELDNLIENYEWNDLYELSNNSEFLNKLSRKLYLSNDLDADIWKRLLNEKKEFYLGIDEFEIINEKKKTYWSIYRQSLEKKGISEEDIEYTESVADKVVNNLKLEKGSSKGLVIGNIQSGKTANMGAVISKAADMGFNYFIVLTGTIEKLRKQSQMRLLHDLADERWIGLEHLKPDMEDNNSSLSKLDIDENKYLTFVLKQPSRLTGLIEWIKSDSEKAKKLKVLVIDDEADQASQNTDDITGSEQTTINRLLTELVNENSDRQYLTSSMNYAAYTATPYANLLNDASDRSLYPKDYIYTLKESRNYIGPVQLFGHSAIQTEEERAGLNIIRLIKASFNSKKEECIFKNGIPRTLQNAFLWFVCGTAVMRYFHYKNLSVC